MSDREPLSGLRFRQEWKQEWCGNRTEHDGHYVPCSELRGHDGPCVPDRGKLGPHYRADKSACEQARCPSASDEPEGAS